MSESARRPGEPSRFVPDTRAAREELGLSETVDLHAAIARTLDWHRTAPRAPRRTI